MEQKKKVSINLLQLLIILAVIALVIIGGIFVVNYFMKPQDAKNIKPKNEEINVNNTNNDMNVSQTSNISIVPTMQDKIIGDSSWCGTFQLIWNDMKNEIVKQDIIFKPQEKIVENLNKEEFTEKMISEDYYYKKYGLKTLKLKEEIEKGIKEKFNQKSDILDDFDWTDVNDENNPELSKYFFYVMLYRKFEFLNQFDKLKNDQFGENYNDIEYFGIDENTDNKVGHQIDVLYYTSQNDFAVKVNTKTQDEVIFCKNPTGENFKEIYDNINKKSEEYTGSKSFEDIDEFKAPKIELNEEKEYTELQNKPFFTADNKSVIIEKAIQTIKFSLDEKGGEIKSEAATMPNAMSAALPEGKEKPRYFYVDDAFAIFLKEWGQQLPYFAGKIEDITKFQ